MAILLLAGCASQPQPTQPDRAESEREPLADVIQLDDTPPSAYLQLAEGADDPTQIYQYLLQASGAFFANQQWQQGAAILSQLEDAQLPRPLDTEYLMQRANLLLHFEQWNSAERTLNEIETTNNRSQRVALIQLQYRVYVGLQRHLSAARQLVELAMYDDVNDYTDYIWEHFAAVPAGYWRQSVRETGDTMRGWTSLFSRMTQALDYREPVAPALERWLQQFSAHPAAGRVQDLIDTHPWINEQPRRIAVLLPLSGQFAQQGMAVRDGVLAALSNERNEDVLFIDTGNNSADSILDLLYVENIEAVIGPLSRDFVDRLAQTIEHRGEPVPWVHLWMNRAPENYPASLDNFFALDIDTEVESAVAYLTEQGHQQVLILGTDTQRGRQLAGQFQQNWQQIHGTGTFSSGNYRSSTEMPNVVEQSLHVQDSKARIERVERAMGSTELHNEPRSRQDVTATYLLGDAAQARLLKPFIETNISPFASRMPVFASSAVHEGAANLGRGDLDGITFSEAPWLLPNHPQSDLLQRFNQLRPNMPPSSHRLVAMGYDAMELLPRISTMNWLPGYDHPGLTGYLRISENAIHRRLHWAMFESSRIMEQTGHEQSYSRDTL